jgi:hypothetical protein
MDKKDIVYVVAALGIILILALVIKPIATGQPVNTGLSFLLPTTTATSTPIPITLQNVTIRTTIPTTPPTPVPTWNTKTKTVTFVDPATYGISTNQSLPGGTRINATQPDTSMTTYATISGKFSGTTQVINIPFPYWELSYTIEPATGPMGGLTQVPSLEVTPTLGENSAHSGISGSYSAVIPVFSIQVMDAQDPNRIVRTITPPGGIDPDLWAGKAQPTPEVTRAPKYAVTVATPTLSKPDPRPWTEKFYEGQRNYYFIINSKFINSYTLNIRVPTRYVGKY